jgi:hypothetical protein
MTYKTKLLFAIVFIISLLFGARWAKAADSTTSNLTTTNLNNWTKSGGSTYVAPDGSSATFNYQGGTLTAPNINLNSTLSSTEIQKGFTTNYGVDIKFWCSNNIFGYCENPTGTKDTVIMTQQLTGSDGSITIQNRTITSGYNPAYVNYQDTLIIGVNSLTNYTITLKLYGIDNGYWAGYWGPTVSNPSLTVDYTKDIQLTTAQTTQIQTTTTSLNTTTTSLNTTTSSTTNTSDLETKLTSTTIIQPTYENIITTNKLSTTTTETQNTNLQQSMITSDTSTSTKETSNAKTSSTQESTTSSTPTSTKTSTGSETTKTTSTETSTSTNTKTEGPQTQTNSKENVADTKVSTNEKGTTNVSVNVKTQIEKVEKELKSIGDKTRAIQEIKLEGIKAGSPNLSVYENRAFYDARIMNGIPNPDFFKQINIEQQQIYKDASLSAYISKDPIAVKQRLLKEIEDEQNSLILEIEMLKKGLKG